MPLIVITGVPSSGKTKRTHELKDFFEGQEKEVHIVSEYEKIVQAGFEKNSFYSDSNKEKHVRGLLKSEVTKLITPRNVVILDALNYIKGYRYELFCATKANKSTQCTIYTIINHDTAWHLNENRTSSEEKYERTVFDELLMRYEEPDGKNRWDSPLFTILNDQTLDMDDIFKCLFNRKPPKPNMSTQNAPLSSTNFLYDLDQITKKILDDLVSAKNNGKEEININGNSSLNVDISNVSVGQLINLRRQYITYSKLNAPDPNKIPDLFVQFLTAALK